MQQSSQRVLAPFSAWPAQTEDVRRLYDVLSEGRVPHAVLLIGRPAVVSQMTEYLAKLLLCQGRPAPCGTCPSCVQFAAGSHPDFHPLEAAGSGPKTAQVGELQQHLNYRAHGGGRVVYVIPGVDGASPIVANRLLKTLEEPLPGVVALLTATHAGRVLPTILSRCFVYRVDDQDKPGEGAAGTPAPVDTQRETSDAEEDVFAAVLPAVIQWTERMLEAREPALLLADALLQLAPSGDAAVPLEVLSTWLRDVLHVQLGDTARIRYKGWSEDLQKQAQLAPTQGLVQAIHLVLDAKTRLQAHVAPQLNYAQMCIRMRHACAALRRGGE